MKTRESKLGFALLTIMIFIMALGLSIGMLARIGQQRIFDAKRQTNRVKALAYAEAGVDFAYAILAQDFNQRDNPSAFLFDPVDEGTVSLSSSDRGVSSAQGLKNAYADGTFTLNLTSISNRYVILNSVGECGDQSVEAEALVEDIFAGSGGSWSDPGYSDMEGFNYAILSGGTFDFSGCGTISAPSGALFHSNGALDLSGNTDSQINISSSVSISIGNNVNVGGDVTAGSLDYKPKQVSIGGTVTKKYVPPVAIPDIDLTPYYNHALANGEVYDSWPGGNRTPKGGVIWINGSADIKSTINGTVIATGDISVLTGAAKVTPGTGRALSVVSRDGNVKMNGGEINGLIYAKNGNFNYQGNGLIKGQVIVNGYIKNAGNSDIMAGYTQSIPTPPSSGSTPTKSLPLISAWQK